MYSIAASKILSHLLSLAPQLKRKNCIEEELYLRHVLKKKNVNNEKKKKNVSKFLLQPGVFLPVWPNASRTFLVFCFLLLLLLLLFFGGFFLTTICH